MMGCLSSINVNRESFDSISVGLMILDSPGTSVVNDHTCKGDNGT